VSKTYYLSRSCTLLYVQGCSVRDIVMKSGVTVLLVLYKGDRLTGAYMDSTEFVTDSGLDVETCCNLLSGQTVMGLTLGIRDRLEMSEIADVLGMSVSGAWEALKRAKKKIKANASPALKEYAGRA